MLLRTRQNVVQNVQSTRSERGKSCTHNLPRLHTLPFSDRDITVLVSNVSAARSNVAARPETPASNVGAEAYRAALRLLLGHSVAVQVLEMSILGTGAALPRNHYRGLVAQVLLLLRPMRESMNSAIA